MFSGRNWVVAAVFLAVAAGAEEWKLLPPSGVYTAPLRVSVGPSDLKVFFTTDGTAPGPGQGKLWIEPTTFSQTIVLRAAAFRAGRPASEVVTRTYIFPEDVLKQAGQGFPSNWGRKNGQSIPADYEMDPEITSDSNYRNSILKSLTSLPSVSLVLPLEEIFGAERGIYAHPEETGGKWERECVFEWIQLGRTNMQVDCGVRIQGGWNRRPEESPKHSFRLVFKKKYGPGKLHFPIFGDAGPKQFDGLILRSGCNNSWLHWSGTERKRGEYIRDQWMRDTFREMGHASAAGTFVHLFLNGLYWGLYNLTERPDASFAASHFGGSEDDYDAFNADKLIQGTREAWNELMRRLRQGTRSSQDLEGISELLDLENFSDYMILNLYGANADWDRASNWYAARRRSPPGKFQFFVWDGERTLENPADNTFAFRDDGSPPGIFHLLWQNDHFRELVAKRARIHLLGHGALTPERSASRYRVWAEKIEPAIAAESARWGDYRRDVHPYKEGPYALYTPREYWRPEVMRLLEEYFPKRTGLFLNQLEAENLPLSPSQKE